VPLGAAALSASHHYATAPVKARPVHLGELHATGHAANSPDLNTVDYSVCGTLQDGVYRAHTSRLSVLKQILLTEYAALCRVYTRIHVDKLCLLVSLVAVYMYLVSVTKLSLTRQNGDIVSTCIRIQVACPGYLYPATCIWCKRGFRISPPKVKF